MTNSHPKHPRPTLKNFGRSNSFLTDHQQYRAPVPSTTTTATLSHPGIDTILEPLSATTTPTINPATITASTPSSARPAAAATPAFKKYAFPGIPTADRTVIPSGIEHSLSHENCAGNPSARTIATLFYRGASYQIPEAPASTLTAFPLEPPADEASEKLDALYGSYVSPLCIAAFLSMMSSFPRSSGSPELSSSHRCLDTKERPKVVELTLSPAPAAGLLSLGDLRKHEAIYAFEREWNVEVILQEDTLWRRHPRLVVFDMDATLITQEVIDLLAATLTEPANIASRVAEITKRAMCGELQFDSAFRERVKLLTGLSADIFVTLRSIINVTTGVPQLLKALQRLGVKTAVLSGGFLPLTGWLAGELGINYAHANEVVINPVTNKLTGEVLGKIVGSERKKELLIEIAEKEKIDLAQVVACGDGANDLLMLEKAGLLGVAWNAKPKVQMAADARLNSETMLDMLYLFGFTSEEISQLTA